MEVLTPKLSIRNLNKSFDGKPVLKNLNFDVMEGEFLSVLGPSGCGKTTLLRILIGLETADSGQILKGGKDISGLPSAQRGMGIVFQNYALFPNMTVLENVQYALTLNKETKAQAKEIALKTLEQVGLMDQLNKLPSQLSGGQQQRVAVARALIHHPAVILADEPTGNLDQKATHEVLSLFESLHRQGHTLVIITHDPSVAEKAPRQIRVEQGRLTDTPADSAVPSPPRFPSTPG